MHLSSFVVSVVLQGLPEGKPWVREFDYYSDRVEGSKEATRRDQQQT